MPASRLPHPIILLGGCIVLAAVLTHVLPAGEYERRRDPQTGKDVVIAGTFHRVEPHPLTPFEALVAVPKGLVDAASVVFFVFLAGAGFTIVDETGALRQGVGWLVHKLQRRELFVIPALSVAFAFGGALENMSEEIIALVPVLLLVTRRLGFDALTAVAVSVGAAGVGAAFSPINPFQAQIAQKLAALPPLSAWRFRLGLLAVALVIWIWGTWRHAARIRRPPDATDEHEQASLRAGGLLVLVTVLATFVAFVYGVVRLGWDFEQMGALFLAMGIVAGLAGGLGFGGTALALVNGVTSMVTAGLLIGFARAIFVTLSEGRIVDTVVNILVSPLQTLPVTLSALGMLIVHAALHVPVPSVSGQAALTMPVLVPIADVIGLSRQVVVLAYQAGAGLTDIITPTNGTIMAVLAAAGVRYEDWFAFAARLFALLLAISAAALVVAIAVGLQ